MVEADSHLKLLHVYILDMYKVFEHINMLSIGLRDIGLGVMSSMATTTRSMRMTLTPHCCAAYYMPACGGHDNGRRMFVEVLLQGRVGVVMAMMAMMVVRQRMLSPRPILCNTRN